MTSDIPRIPPRGGSGVSQPKEPVTNEQVLRVIAFVTVVVPTAVAANVLLWSIAGWFWRH